MNSDYFYRQDFGDEIAFTREVAEFGSTTGTASREAASAPSDSTAVSRATPTPLLTDHSRREAHSVDVVEVLAGLLNSGLMTSPHSLIRPPWQCCPRRHFP